MNNIQVKLEEFISLNKKTYICKMKKYILVIFGDFSSDELAKELALDLTPLVDSPNLKFQRTTGSMLFHFASEVIQDEIVEYLDGILIDRPNHYIMTEYSDNVSVSFPDDVKKHLFDLENNTEDVYINMSVGSSTKKELSEDDDEFVALLLEQIKERVKKPSLDTLLDKINSKGIDSLSPFEKEVLKEITQNLNS
jgi:hypothetical protein